MRHIITIGFHSKHIFKPIRKYGADEVFLIYSYQPTSTQEEREIIKKTKREVAMIMESLGLPYTFIEVNPYEFSLNVEKFRKIIRKPTVINLTGGKRIVAFALLYAALYEQEKVEKVVYVSVEGDIVEFPRFLSTAGLTKLEKRILGVCDEKNISEIARDLGISLSTASVYIDRLRRKGFVKIIEDGRRKIVKKLI